MDRDDYLLLAFLAGIWGASFLFIKIAVQDIPPISMVFLSAPSLPRSELPSTCGSKGSRSAAHS